MRPYQDLVELARQCALQSRIATNKEVAIELWKMAKEYQAEAAKLNGGKLPDIGDEALLWK